MSLIRLTAEEYCKKRGLVHIDSVEKDVRHAISMMPSKPLNKTIRRLRDECLERMRTRNDK